MSVELKWTGERLVPSILDELAIEHLARYAFCIPHVLNKNVLDLACGEGYGSFLLAKAAKHVSGVDIDEGTIRHAQLKYKKENLDFIKSEATNLPFQNETFDVVVCYETLEHVRDQSRMMAEMKRVLKRDGLLFLSTPNKDVYTIKSDFKNRYHEKELDRKEFTTLLQSYFRYISLFNQRNLYGSCIYRDETQISQIEEASGNYQQIDFSQKTQAPVYFMAVASNEILPSTNPLIFGSENIYEARFVALKQTWTYKIGDIILAPFKWLRRLMNK